MFHASNCSSSMSEDLCCGTTMEMLSQTITIVDHGDHGDMTIVATNNPAFDDDETDTDYATIEVDGTDITVTMGGDDDHDDHDHDVTVMMTIMMTIMGQKLCLER